ncbi:MULTISPECIES: M15 family metallopeptidase [Saccharibacillus]|uniref:M15 family metallopeptidase n=1 Tax=Saccharibacillus TaxID=456492 RepID=UPI00123B1F64|nr:M15 family metallopeptidase [Saccharibacillus sp. WB 17]MWJ30161.1 D-Ala-D-Ala carboxypeptidase VanY [Saccharibacillus sp. WB 17]
MKRRGFLVLVIALLLAAAIVKGMQRGDDGYGAAEGLIQEIALRSSGEKLLASEEQLYEGDLLLVNGEYPMHPESEAPDVVELSGRPELTGGAVLLDNDIRLSRGVALKFAVMAEAAAQEGVNRFMISSGYRDRAEQSRLYKEKGADYALPAGYSEHNMGLALDIGSTRGRMADAEEGKWLEQNAARYGFVLRYPADKTDVTGISFEPWHFRYVGLPHSLIMKRSNLALEEYVELLRDKKAVSTTVDGRSYEIRYYDSGEIPQLRVPEGREYALSGDNKGGLILTLYP